MADSKYFGIPFAASGDKATIPEATQPSGTVSFQQGFGPDYERDPATDPLSKPVPRDETNELYYQITNSLKYLQLYGTPEWYATDGSGNPVSYPLSARVRYDAGAGAGMQAWRSIVANNIATPGSDPKKWVLDLPYSEEYAVHDTSGGANYALPALTSVPNGWTRTVKFDGMRSALPLSAVTVTSGGNINLNGISASSVPTFGRGEVIRFRRTSAGYDAEILKNAPVCFLRANATSGAAVTGPTGGYTAPTFLTNLTGEANATFGYSNGVVTIPVTGRYQILMTCLFSAAGAAGGGGLAFGDSPLNIGLAYNKSYNDLGVGFSNQQTTAVTSIFPAGRVIDFKYALTNSAARFLPTDMGIAVDYLGR